MTERDVALTFTVFFMAGCLSAAAWQISEIMSDVRERRAKQRRRDAFHDARQKAATDD